MSALLKRYPLAAALALVALLLAVIVAFELASGSSLKGAGGAARERASPVQAKLLPPVMVGLSEQAYPETGARPLFTPTRRPAPAAASAGASTMNKGQFVLSGVTIAGNLKIALLREKSSGRVVRVEQGREVNGMTVAQIDPDHVTLVQGGDQEVVSLLVQKAGAASGAPPPTPPAGPFASSAPPGGATAGAANVPPAASQPQPAMPRPANPAARAMPAITAPGGFGPYPAQPGAEAAAEAAAAAQQPQAQPLTPEELLARRRARRSQQTR